MTDTPAAVLVNSDGQLIDTLVDEVGKRRVGVDAYLNGQVDPIEVTVPGGAPSNLATLVRTRLEIGGNPSLLVDGSSAEQHFDFPADTTDDIKLFEVRIKMSANDITLDGAHFGGSSPLTNGLRFTVKSDGVETEMGVVKLNEEFFLLPFADILFDTAGPKDFLSLAQKYNGAVTLKGGTDDRARITVRDDLTSNAYNIGFFQAAVLGVKV